MTVIIDGDSFYQTKSSETINYFIVNQIEKGENESSIEDEDSQQDTEIQNKLLYKLRKMVSCKPLRHSCKCSVCLFLSIGLTVFSIAFLFALEPLVKSIISNKLVIIQGTLGHRFWKDPPAIIQRKMYIWHCTNPTDVQNGGIPELIEKGPYVYREQWNRSNIFYSDDLDTLSYAPITTLFFDRNQSIGPDDENVTVINVPLLAMAHEIIYNFTDIQIAANFLLELLQTKLFVTVTVKELMEGYTDPLIETASLVKPGALRDNKFGILQARNGSYYQNYTIHTGYNDIQQVAKVITFNGMKSLNFWSTPQANMLNGTDASLYPPFLSKDRNVYSYSADMCRSYYLSFLRERNDGLVTLYDYHLSADVFNMSREENRGFCGKGPCLGDGVLNISTCYSGVWGFISSPHFFQSDEKFRRDVHGMNPDSSKHEFIMSFDPLTSVPFDVNVRLQLSFYLPNMPKIDLLKSVRPTLVPVVWFDDEARLTPDIHSEMTLILVAYKVASYVKFVLPAVGIILVSISVAYIYRQWKQARNDRVNSKVPLLNSGGES